MMDATKFAGTQVLVSVNPDGTQIAVLRVVSKDRRMVDAWLQGATRQISTARQVASVCDSLEKVRAM